jgi:hypothetical protein
MHAPWWAGTAGSSTSGRKKASLMSEIEEGLRLIRVRQQRLAHILWALVPFVLIAGYLSSSPSDSNKEEIVFVLAAVLYGVVLLAYSFRLAFTECPRCHRFYHWNWWSNPWTQKCLHCGLPLKMEQR